MRLFLHILQFWRSLRNFLHLSIYPKSIKTELNKLGAKVEEEGDSLIIQGVSTFKGGAEVSAWNDHRIAMSLAIASTRCEDEIVIDEAESVKKSYPHFWDDFEKMGGKIEKICL